MSRKRKQYTQSEIKRKELLLKHGRNIKELSIELLAKDEDFQQTFRLEYPEATTDEIIASAKPGAKYHKLWNQLIKSPAFKEQAQNIEGLVADFHKDKIDDIIGFSANTTILANKEKIQPAIKQATELPGLDDLYKNMNLKSEFFDTLENYAKGMKPTPNKQSGSALIKNAIGFNSINYQHTNVKAAQSINGFVESVEQLYKTGKVMAFDFETMGGTDEYGYKHLRSKTEFAYGVYDMDTKTYSKKVETVIGLNQKEYDELVEVINNNFGKGTVSNEAKVMMHRAGLYGTAELGKDAEGMYTVKMKDAVKGHNYTKDEMLKGAARLRDIYQEQSKIMAPSGLTLTQQRYAEMLAMMNDPSISKLGYNIKNADIPWTNQLLAKNGLNLTEQQLPIFKKIAGFAPNAPMFINSDGSDFVDARIGAQYSTVFTGTSKFYQDAEGRAMAQGQTALSQEGLTRALFPELYKDGAAHAASFDIDAVINLIDNPNGRGLNGETFLQSVMADIKANQIGNTKLQGQVNTNGLDLFYAPNSTGYYAGGNSPLDYVYDPVNKQYRTGNKKLLKADGSIGKDLISENQSKRGRMYTVGFAGEVEVTDEFLKQFDGIHDSMLQQKLYMLRLDNYIDPSVAGVNNIAEGHSVKFFQSKDQMESFLSNMIHIGHRESINSSFKPLAPNEGGAEVERMFKEYKVLPGGIETVDKEFDFDELLKDLSNRDINDAAARALRDNDYNKAKKFNDFYDLLKTKNGGQPMSATDAQTIMKQLIASQDQELAITVASGNKINISFKEVQNILGYYDASAKEQVLMSNTLNNQMTAYNFMASQVEVSKAVINSLDSGANQWEYNAIMNGIIEQAAEDVFNNENNQRMFWQNGYRQSIYGKDLDYFNFDLSDTIDNKMSTFNTVKKPNIDENILRVNLTPGKQYDFKRQLAERYVPNYRQLNPVQREQEEIMQLKNFITNVMDSGNTPGLFKDFTESRIAELSEAGSDTFALEIINSIKGYREKNPTAGFLTETWSSDPQNINLVMDYLNKSGKTNEYINKVKQNLPKYKEVNSSNIQQYIDNLVDNVLVDNIDPIKFIKEAGFTDKAQQQYFEQLYYTAKNEYKEFLGNYISNFTKAGDTKFMFDETKNAFALINGNEALHLELPRIKAREGMLHLDMYGSKIGIHSVLDFEAGMVGDHFDPTKLKFGTNIGKAINESLGNKYAVKSMAEQGVRHKDILGKANAVMKNVGAKLREGSSVQAGDLIDMQHFLQIDMSNMYEAVSAMAKDGMLDNVDWRDKEFVNLFKKGVNNAINSSTQRETLQKNIPFIMQLINKMRGSEDSGNAIDLIAKNLTSYNKEGPVSEGKMQFGLINHLPGLQFDNNARPILNQTRTAYYRVSEYEAAMAKRGNQYKGVISLNNSLTNDFTAINNRRRILGMGVSTDKITGKKLNISELGFRAKLESKNISGNPYFDLKKESEKKIYNRIKGINLTEQEQIINTRVMDDFFNKSRIQRINSKKELSFYMNINESTINEAKELGAIKAKFSVNEKGEVVFKYGSKVEKQAREHVISIHSDFNDSSVLAKMDGLMGFGYFSKTDGNLISEKEINTLIKGMSESEARTYLAENFDSSWYVEAIDQADYKKILQGYSEKGMARAYYGRLGEFDERIADVVTSVTQRDNLKTNILGRTLNKEAMDFYLYGRLDENDIILKQAGFNSLSEFKEAVESERHIIQDRMNKIYGNVAIISNHSEAGHNNTQFAFSELVESMKNERMYTLDETEEDALKAVYDDLTQGGAFVGFNPEFKDGAIHYPNKLEAGAGYDNKAIAKILEENDVYKNLRKDAKGRTLKLGDKDIGTYTYTMLSEAHSDLGISSHMNRDAVKALKDIDETINKAYKDKRSRSEIEGLIEKRKEISAAYKGMSKGHKITDRELNMLNSYVYDNDFVRRAQSAMEGMTDADGNDLFESVYGHILDKDANGNFKVKDEFLGKPMLQEYTDDLLAQWKYGDSFSVQFDGDTDLSMYYKDSNVKKGIQRIVDREGFISQEAAETVYSLGRTQKAVKFNIGEMSLEAMQKEGFTVMSSEDIYRSIRDGANSIDHPNSIYNKNIIIDLGEKAGYGKNRYVALPYAATPLAGDNIIRNEFQKSVAGVLAASDELDAFLTHNDTSGKTLEELQAKLARRIDALKISVDNYWQGKNGISSNFHVRLDRSVSATSSSLTVFNPEEAAKRKSEFMDVWNNALEKHAGEDNQAYLALKDLNSESLSTAMLDGKSILQHYKEGRYISANFRSIEQFEAMGFFDEEYMKSVGVSNRDDMIKLLKTEGVMSNTTRTPTIMQSSTAPMMMYLDESLAGNETKTLIEAQLAYNGDNDGDRIISSVLSINGQDSLQASRSGANEYAWRNVKANMYYRSTTEGKYWHEKVLGTLDKDYEKALKNGNYFSLTASKEFDGVIYSALGINPTIEGVMDNEKVLNEFNQLFEERHKKTFSSTGSGMLEMADEMLAEMDDDTATKFRNAIAFDYSFGMSEIAGQAKVRKRAIGEMNNPLFRLRKTAELAIDSTEDSLTRDIIGHVAVGAEQEAISAKKGDLRYLVDKTDRFKEAFNNLTSGSVETASRGKQQMLNWLDSEDMNGRLEDYLNNLRSVGKVDENFTVQDIKDKFVDSLYHIGMTEQNKLKAYDSYGQRLSSASIDTLNRSARALDVVTTGRASYKEQAVEIAIKSNNLTSEVLDAERIKQQYKDSVNKAVQGNYSDGILRNKQSQERIKRNLQEVVGQGVEDMAGSKFAMGAIALSTAFMLTGFMGNNAAQPSDQQMAQDLSQQEVQLSDMQGKYTISQGPNNNGYVINIKGQGNANAINRSQYAMNQTVMNSSAGNMNINMNITDSSGNINDRYLDQMISGLL